MRLFLSLFILHLAFLTSRGQSDSVGVFIPKDDGSPFNWPTKHMWVGMLNPIASDYAGSYDFIKVWTDNGVADSGDHYFSDYAIIPEHEGEVTVYSIQRIWRGKHYDTITTKSVFTAIASPKISLRIAHDNFTKDSTLTFELIDNSTGKPADNRYKVGRMYVPYVYDSNYNQVGIIYECFGTTIDLSYKRFYRFHMQSGYTLKFTILVRDMKTDLLIAADTFTYTLK